MSGFLTVRCIKIPIISVLVPAAQQMHVPYYYNIHDVVSMYDNDTHNSGMSNLVKKNKKIYTIISIIE